MARAHPMVAGLCIGLALSGGLWALGLSVRAHVWVLAIGAISFAAIMAWDYPDAYDREGWERWYAERDRRESD